MAKWSGGTYLSDRERDEIDLRGRMILRRCRERVAALEEGERGELLPHRLTFTDGCYCQRGRIKSIRLPTRRYTPSSPPSLLLRRRDARESRCSLLTAQTSSGPSTICSRKPSRRSPTSRKNARNDERNAFIPLGEEPLARPLD